MLPEKTHEFYMKKAYELAQLAYEKDEVPVGAVVVCNNQIIGKGYNQVETLRDATAHAEMLAITAASEFLNSKYLHDCTLYVTIEPCVMCAGALKWSQIGSIVYGAPEPNMGFQSKEVKIFPEKTVITGGIMSNECAELMLSFFRSKRE